MKQKILLLGIVLFIGVGITICFKKIGDNDIAEKVDAIQFKEEYESLNGKSNNNGKNYRNVLIGENNPIIYITMEELLEKLDNQESFYVSFGSKFCPWCRSVIEKAIISSINNGINVIYYIDIWDEEGNEIVRDKYDLTAQNEIEQMVKGTDTYYELLDTFDNVLSDYALKDKDGNVVNIGEKRIFAPNFIYVKKGIAQSLISGISAKQQTAYEKLTEEILKEEMEILNTFFEEDCGC